MFKFYERFCNRIVTAEVTETNRQEEGQKMTEVKRVMTDRSIDRHRQVKKSIKNECGQERVKNEIVQISAAWEKK